MVFDPAPLLEYLQFVFVVLVSLIVLIPIIYVAFRAASLGWYKSRYEHLRKIWNQQSGEDQ